NVHRDGILKMRTFPVADLPRFGKPLNNLTVSVSREAILTCIVENLGPYKRALSRILRVKQQRLLLQYWQQERAPCNLAAENRENRKVKMKLQVVKESGVVTFSWSISTYYVYGCKRKMTPEIRTAEKVPWNVVFMEILRVHGC
ncbi:hypothetical protein WH47_01291, partial [Habropoda laboriosa]